MMSERGSPRAEWETGSSEDGHRFKSQQRFGRYAAEYVRSSSHAEGYDLERLVELAEPLSHWKVLDVATGGGHTAARFAPLVGKMVAADLTFPMLTAARDLIRDRDLGNIEFTQADAGELPYADRSFNLVTCRIAPHHFYAASRFVREGYRVLRNEGIFLVQDHLLPDDEAAARYIDDFERRRDPSHNRGFSESAWVEMFKSAGFHVEHLEEITKRHHLSNWARRQGCSDDMIAVLAQMLEDAPPVAAGWLQPEGVGTPAASFVNHHILIAGRKRLNMPA